MKLSRLLDGCDIITASGTQTVPDADIEITALTTDSRSARRGSLFVCISGARSDGHAFAASAYEAAVASLPSVRLTLRRMRLSQLSRRHAVLLQ